jgi:hypothetical protein
MAFEEAVAAVLVALLLLSLPVPVAGAAAW